MKLIAFLAVIALVVAVGYLAITWGYGALRRAVADWEVDEVIERDVTKVYAVKYGETPDLVRTVRHDVEDFEYEIEEARSAARVRVTARRGGER